jgi:murein L,D-transpeptidase YcbB/YkuD
MRFKITSALLIIIIFWSCKIGKQKKEVIRDTTITEKTSFNNLFLDSTTIEKFVSEHEIFTSYKEQFIDFYKQRNYEYAWFDTSGITEQSAHFINLLNNAITTLQDSSLYNHQLFLLFDSVQKKASKYIEVKERNLTELFLTGQFFAYAAKVYKGSDIDVSELGWFIPRKKLDLKAILDSTLKANNSEAYIPLNTQYKKLQDYLSKYIEIDKAKETDTITHIVKPLKKGMEDESIIAIKNRLQLLGDLELNDSSAAYDSTLLVAVKKFQRRFGLSVDGTIGNKMIDELNVPVKDRIRSILINMERARWMPADKDTNYILVNIPEYKMHVYDSGKLQFDISVIVGTATNNTVIFTDKLKYIVFSPYWNVPSSIVKKEIVPAMNKNPNYLAKNNMEITGKSGGLPVVRQKPGPNNSLGLVKFLFPNSFNIYFHDTPNHDLFSATNRSFSHGCIRLNEPKKLAMYLLRNDTTWTSSKVDSCMHLQKEKWVTLNKTIPVFIVYFTAWVDKNGALNFRKDIYGHDAKMNEKLFVKK